MQSFTKWEPINLSSKSYLCGHCGVTVAPSVGFMCRQHPTLAVPHLDIAFIYICINCHRPTLEMPGESLSPAPKPGTDIAHLPPTVQKLYNEIRSSMQVGAFTGAVALCRTMIAHVSHEKLGTPTTVSFKAHLDALYASDHLAIGQKIWIDKIRTTANKGIHNLEIISSSEAAAIFDFTQMLLTLLYSFPATLPSPEKT